jgi:hypothetical protein
MDNSIGIDGHSQACRIECALLTFYFIIQATITTGFDFSSRIINRYGEKVPRYSKEGLYKLGERDCRYCEFNLLGWRETTVVLEFKDCCLVRSHIHGKLTSVSRIKKAKMYTRISVYYAPDCFIQKIILGLNASGSVLRCIQNPKVNLFWSAA